MEELLTCIMKTIINPYNEYYIIIENTNFKEYLIMKLVCEVVLVFPHKFHVKKGWERKMPKYFQP